MPGLRRKPKTLTSAIVATARFFPSDEISADVMDSSPCAGYQYSHITIIERMTDLKNDLGNKLSSFRAVDLRG